MIYRLNYVLYYKSTFGHFNLFMWIIVISSTLLLLLLFYILFRIWKCIHFVQTLQNEEILLINTKFWIHLGMIFYCPSAVNIALAVNIKNSTPNFVKNIGSACKHVCNKNLRHWLNNKLAVQRRLKTSLFSKANKFRFFAHCSKTWRSVTIEISTNNL